jgi:hypothetical protein
MNQRASAQEETRIAFYTTAHQHYCGIDLHAKTMYLCILDGEAR